jgi:hypothetical protein
VDPSVQVAKRLRTQRVEVALPVRADPDEAPVMKDAKMARDARLTYGESGDEIAHGALSAAELLDDT